MRLFRITRSFSQGFPSDLITNIPTIDAYLHTIEQELPGRSKRLKLPLHDNMNNADLFQARLYTSLEHPQ